MRLWLAAILLTLALARHVLAGTIMALNVDFDVPALTAICTFTVTATTPVQKLQLDLIDAQAGAVILSAECPGPSFTPSNPKFKLVSQVTKDHLMQGRVDVTLPPEGRKYFVRLRNGDEVRESPEFTVAVAPNRKIQVTGAPLKRNRELTVMYVSTRDKSNPVNYLDVAYLSNRWANWGVCKLNVPADRYFDPRPVKLVAASKELVLKGEPAISLQDGNKHQNNATGESSVDFAWTDSSLTSKGIFQGRKVFLFVHGYNIATQDALVLGASMSSGAGFDGIPIVFTWPSKGENPFDAFRYASELDRCDESAEALQQVLGQLEGASEVHLVAHSMGGRLLLQALGKTIGTAPTSSTLANLKSVTFFAPDVPIAPIRKEYMRRVVDLASKPRVSLFFHRGDKALEGSSNWLRGGGQNTRMGLSGLDGLPKLAQFDSKNLQTDSALHHSYIKDFRATEALQWILSDVPEWKRGVELVLGLR